MTESQKDARLNEREKKGKQISRHDGVLVLIFVGRGRGKLGWWLGKRL
jgi:hypothetical protein